MENEWLLQLTRTTGIRLPKTEQTGEDQGGRLLLATNLPKFDSTVEETSSKGEPIEFPLLQLLPRHWNDILRKPKFLLKRRVHSSPDPLRNSSPTCRGRPRHLSDFTFQQYTGRFTKRPLSSNHSVDTLEIPNSGMAPRIHISFAKQVNQASLVTRSYFLPGYYSPEPYRTKSHVVDFSKQLSREKAQNRGQSCTCQIPDRSLSRSCSLIIPRRKSATIWPQATRGTL